ncbi:RusA family crossover junction endodeoxyribonuclease [Paenibacillus polysaccharolyticus]|uniref:RusA family crossover junction endodeoxyribonuclease n=1 Tax=Paenibacillus polysaccharolyticus TaxID=582692 RepID=UPI0020419EA0|nr:RusA family crossover junction endodeoxyribonuclease [Paenibacillus polysaccharolyticus]MCM3131858.1 RusA family crossover junction endodeoxyribonuclease [Paenibacillus polysaccharolyticus]
MERLILNGTAPSVNHMYNHRMVKKKLIKTMKPEARAWFDEASLRARLWRNKNKWSTASEKVVVRLWYYFPDERRRDTHNTLKALLDALESGGIYADDKTALPRIMDYEVDKKNPRIEIEFEKVV